MGRRAELHTMLKLITPKVYFQPPANVQLEYPCLVYHRDDIQVAHADNAPYRRTTRYMLTVIDRNPDSEIVEDISALPLCNYNRSYAVDNLNHDVFILYF